MTLFKKVYNSLYIDSGNINETVLIVGTGRSGTTWLEDLVNCDNKYRIMFEPFHSYKVKDLQTWQHRQYIKTKDNNPEYHQVVKKILSGNIRNSWIDRFNKKKIVRKRLIKDIRIHLMLPWLHYNFSFIPIIYIIRHPCAVASSKLAQNNWQSDLEPFLSQKELIADFFQPFVSHIKQAKSPFQKHIYLWCIENYFVLHQFKKDGLLPIFYEDICTQPMNEAKRIESYLGVNLSAKFTDVVQTPSALSNQKSAITLGQNPVTSWKNKMSIEMQQEALDICKLFGLDILYTREGMPAHSANEALNLFEML